MSQRKYTLNQKACENPMEHSIKYTDQKAGVPMDNDRYKRLVDRLLSLSHTRPDISNATSILSQFMNCLTKKWFVQNFEIFKESTRKWII